MAATIYATPGPPTRNIGTPTLSVTVLAVAAVVSKATTLTPGASNAGAGDTCVAEAVALTVGLPGITLHVGVPGESASSAGQALGPATGVLLGVTPSDSGGSTIDLSLLVTLTPSVASNLAYVAPSLGTSVLISLSVLAQLGHVYAPTSKVFLSVEAADSTAVPQDASGVTGETLTIDAVGAYSTPQDLSVILSPVARGPPSAASLALPQDPTAVPGAQTCTTVVATATPACFSPGLAVGVAAVPALGVASDLQFTVGAVTCVADPASSLGVASSGALNQIVGTGFSTALATAVGPLAVPGTTVIAALSVNSLAGAHDVEVRWGTFALTAESLAVAYAPVVLLGEITRESESVDATAVATLPVASTDIVRGVPSAASVCVVATPTAVSGPAYRELTVVPVPFHFYPITRVAGRVYPAPATADGTGGVYGLVVRVRLPLSFLSSYGRVIAPAVTRSMPVSVGHGKTTLPPVVARSSSTLAVVTAASAAVPASAALTWSSITRSVSPASAPATPLSIGKSDVYVWSAIPATAQAQAPLLQYTNTLVSAAAPAATSAVDPVLSFVNNVSVIAINAVVKTPLIGWVLNTNIIPASGSALGVTLRATNSRSTALVSATAVALDPTWAVHDVVRTLLPPAAKTSARSATLRLTRRTVSVSVIASTGVPEAPGTRVRLKLDCISSYGRAQLARTARSTPVVAAHGATTALNPKKTSVKLPAPQPSAGQAQALNATPYPRNSRAVGVATALAHANAVTVHTAITVPVLGSVSPAVPADASTSRVNVVLPAAGEAASNSVTYTYGPPPAKNQAVAVNPSTLSGPVYRIAESVGEEFIFPDLAIDSVTPSGVYNKVVLPLASQQHVEVLPSYQSSIVLEDSYG